MSSATCLFAALLCLTCIRQLSWSSSRQIQTQRQGQRGRQTEGERGRAHKHRSRMQLTAPIRGFSSFICSFASDVLRATMRPAGQFISASISLAAVLLHPVLASSIRARQASCSRPRRLHLAPLPAVSSNKHERTSEQRQAARSCSRSESERVRVRVRAKDRRGHWSRREQTNGALNKGFPTLFVAGQRGWRCADCQCRLSSWGEQRRTQQRISATVCIQ